MSEQKSDGLKEMRERISGYHVYDRHYEKVGKVDDLFVDENDELEYIGLKMGGMLKSKTALVPMEMVRINDRRDLIEIEADKKQIEDSPTFGKDEEITSEYESEVYRHFGLQSPDSSEERGSYGDYDEGEGRREEGSGEERDDDDVDTEYGERAGSGDHHGEARSVDRHDEESPSRSEETDRESSSRSGDEESPSRSEDRDRSGAATGERATSGDGSREPQRTEQRDDERSPRSESGGPGREPSGAVAEGGRREDPSSGSSGGPRVRKRLRVSERREETADAPDGTVGSGGDMGRRTR